MVFVVDDFAEELLVGCFEQILEQWNVRRTESAVDAAAEECVDSLPIGCRNKSMGARAAPRRKKKIGSNLYGEVVGLSAPNMFSFTLNTATYSRHRRSQDFL